ncbi:hypothetical protein [Mycobacterium sp. IS-2888]|uniref:hypothetical protein n=1 Tax=Mycobacterium sp. IS-2888 TaxID=1834159 RepID=UPI0011159A62|nr:hypothetical protein [Mycobacterium sp. IS-2888]
MISARTLKRLIAGTLLSTGVAMAGFGLAAGAAQAQPGLAPQVYWCPNQPWNPAWGENKYWNQCWDTDNPPAHPPPPPFHQPNFNCGLFWCPVPPHP